MYSLQLSRVGYENLRKKCSCGLRIWPFEAACFGCGEKHPYEVNGHELEIYFGNHVLGLVHPISIEAGKILLEEDWKGRNPFDLVK
jgi:hypothetical protein